MALLSKKDVQKASYYVWFLGAQESRELRGDRVLISTIPRLIDRSRHQEPLKVTLQISHKGLKIIQGSSKHFIPHNAITCSIVEQDIVACVLLLYNPVTKCPLHVHAYRCDSDATAHALNDQLQILIKKPENQKRFAELELKLEHSLKAIERSKPLSMPERKESRNFEMSTRRFDSSLGSDTGTSTRESDCSEEHQHSPIEAPTHLYDSLAAELRAKLNGNGPPLLLPPRDYDTISRSQGNLKAVDLRRCQNLSIVGKEIRNIKRNHISSYGSSGIGSDLAPSPERQEELSTSSSEDWKNDEKEINPNIIRKMEKLQIRQFPVGEKLSPTRSSENPPSYIFPKDSVDNYKAKNKFEKSAYRKQTSRDENIPNIMNKHIKEAYDENSKKYYHHKQIKEKGHTHTDDERIISGGLMKRQVEIYRQMNNINDSRKHLHNSYEEYDRENLTDRQKYREILDIKRYQHRPDDVERQRNNEPRPISPEIKQQRTLQRKSKSSGRYEVHEIPSERSRNKSKEEFVERNPYRESESLPYRQSIESMLKSPVMKYKSRTDYQTRSPSPNYEMHRRDSQNRNHLIANRVSDRDREIYVKDSSPISTMKRTSPKDRFQNAKEKFQAMEKMRLQHESKSKLNIRRSEPSRYDANYRQSCSPEPRFAQGEWSSEEEYPNNIRDYRNIPPAPRASHYHHQQRMVPAKSLGNLPKGYRHSYAEPIKYCNRVGLAAIEPF